MTCRSKDLPPREGHVWMAILPLLLTAVSSGCAGQQVKVAVDQVRQQAALARENGAMRCAPRQLALAEANAAFASGELEEGDYLRARQHLEIAEENAREALRLSPRDRCLGPAAAGDRDGDGIADASDQCPVDPEDKDDFEDADGCPDRDNDKDGLADASDRCPLDPEDKDGFEDSDGCPDPDNDKDGLADGDDQCPVDPEDKDGFEDSDGCPDPDNDKDKIADGDDKCPLQAGPAENDGCPKTYDHIVVTREKIELRQKVFFETNKAVIMSRSYGLLAEIANVLQTAPAMKLRIEGHTDIRGTAKRNISLSQARANEVRSHLVGLGIAPDRLEARGFGSEQAIETNKTAAGRERNRRVEFVITEQ